MAEAAGRATEATSRYWAEPVESLLGRLGAAPDGLASTEASARLVRFGQNVVASTAGRSSVLRLLGAQFTSPIVVVLVVAAIVSVFVGDRADALVILGIVTASGLLGFWQEKGAADAVAGLLRLVEVKATVIRDGLVVKVLVAEVVPGDVVELGAGSIIPADGIILESTNLEVDESSLTGEAFPVAKRPGPVDAGAALAERSNTCHLGSHVVSGEGRLLVVATGAATELGTVSARLAAKAPPTEFEQGLRRLGNLLLRVTVVLTVGIFIANVVLNKPVLDSFLFSVALAVGLTPQLLPAIVAVNLSHGARRMADAKVIVRRLAAIENFGAMTVFCSDKTGTLTAGLVTVAGGEDAAGRPTSRVVELARVNAALETGYVNPIDEALRSEAPPLGYSWVAEVPYDFERKRLTVLVDGPDGRLMITKGALTEVLGVCATGESADGPVPISAVSGGIESRRAELEGAGMRLLGVAVRPHERDGVAAVDEDGMTFVGMVSLADPPKADARLSVSRLHDLGVAVKMITGDSRRVAAHVADEVGLEGGLVLTGADMASLDDDALAGKVSGIDVFAEVDPSQKERIVAAFRRAGEVVGYMGDGINDAPALHVADVSVSVDTAVDVAKEAADFVLLERDLAVLAAGVEAGRATFGNTMKYVFAATSANFGNMFSMAGASFFLPYLPLLPKQVLLTNVLTDLPEMTIAADRVDKTVIDRPERWDVDLIRRFMLVFGLVSSLFDYATFGVLLVVLGAGQDEFRTGWFVESVVSAAMIVLIVRTRLPVVRSRPGKALSAATVGVVTFVLALPYLPIAPTLGLVALPGRFYAALAGVVVAYGGAAELTKRWFFRPTVPSDGAQDPRRRRRAGSWR